MTIQTKNLTLYKGDTRIFRIGFDGGGLPFEPKSAQWAMTVRGQTGEELRPQISVSGQEIIITFPAHLTQNIAWTLGQYDLRAVFGGIVCTVLRGEIYIAPSITNVSGIIGESTEPIRVSIMEQGLVVVSPAEGTPTAGVSPEKIREIVKEVIKETQNGNGNGTEHIPSTRPEQPVAPTPNPAASTDLTYETLAEVYKKLGNK